MVAAENDALPGLKVGGIGDVLRDLPPALAAAGVRVSVVTPAYGLTRSLPALTRVRTLEVSFAGATQRVTLCRTTPEGSHDGVSCYVLDHPLFATCGRGAVYCDDGPTRPFATDASKFALFGAAVAEAFTADAFGEVDVVHLHDWHAAMVLILAHGHPRYARLRTTRTVFTIHNLALQGVRPLAGDSSSLRTWFPGLRVNPEAIVDRRWSNCVNPMAAGIRLAGAVSTVSPSYAREILEPNAVERAGFHGGEGLETDLQAVHREGRLVGILNGCAYPAPPTPDEAHWPRLLEAMREESLVFAAGEPRLRSAHFVAMQRLAALDARRPRTLVTSIGRLATQKLGLLQVPLDDGRSALEALLAHLGDDGLLVALGTGDPGMEQFMTRTMAQHPGLVFLRGYSSRLAAALYAGGDLFLMPSSYEPCGISQMLAMREGQPCLVHGVGGLRDTVLDDKDGFVFGGETVTEQARGLVDTFARALSLRRNEPQRWESLRRVAAAARFSWSDSAAAYVERLYRPATAARRRDRPSAGVAPTSPRA
jgi:starch synthase